MNISQVAVLVQLVGFALFSTGPILDTLFLGPRRAERTVRARYAVVAPGEEELRQEVARERRFYTILTFFEVAGLVAIIAGLAMQYRLAA